MKNISCEETVLELLDVCQEFVKIYEHMGLQVPPALLKKIIRITKQFKKTETSKENEQTITKDTNKS